VQAAIHDEQRKGTVNPETREIPVNHRAKFQFRCHTLVVNSRSQRSRLKAHTASHIMCDMKNITLSVDEKVLKAVRRYAAERDSSVNRLVREFLRSVSEREDRARNARLRIQELSRRSTARVGVKTWDREGLHDR